MIKTKYISIFSIICFVIVLFCISYSNSKHQINIEQSSEAFIDAFTWQCIDLSTYQNESDSSITISAKDTYDSLGYGWIQCNKTGYYRFEASGNLYDSYSPNADDLLVWKVYVLNEIFVDSPSGIPFMTNQLNIAEDQYIEKGQYIVIYCSQNSKSYGYTSEYNEGDENALFICKLLE